MADALISPAVGATMWAVSSAMAGKCANEVKAVRDDRLVPMMGVLGAFIFTAQMINFSVPGTGSSGHLGGGLLLAILLGPHAAFLVIASVLTVQSLFFADGGLLALGCNIFNLGFFPAFIAYPFIYKPLAKGRQGTRAWVAALVAAIAGLQMGAFGVVLETQISGISALPFGTFAMLMQPIHLAIGVVEGLATAAIIGFVSAARPEALAPGPANTGSSTPNRRLRPVIVGFLLSAMLIGGALSWFASKRPDGLEWAVTKLTGHGELPLAKDGPHQRLARLQKSTAILPDYGFKTAGKTRAASVEAQGGAVANASTSLAGFLGGSLTLIVCGVIGCVLKCRRAAI